MKTKYWFTTFVFFTVPLIYWIGGGDRELAGVFVISLCLALASWFYPGWDWKD